MKFSYYCSKYIIIFSASRQDQATTAADPAKNQLSCDVLTCHASAGWRPASMKKKNNLFTGHQHNALSNPDIYLTRKINFVKNHIVKWYGKNN